MTPTSLLPITCDLRLRLCVVFTWLLGILTYGYHYAGANMAFDALIGVDLFEDIRPKIDYGRYGQLLNYYCIRSFAAAPWMIGVLTMLWLTLSNFLIVKLFSIKNKFEILLLCGITVMSIPFIQTHALYFHEIDNFALALLTSILSIYLYITKPFKASIVVAVLTYALSISFYQPYMVTVPSLFIILLIRDIMAGAGVRTVVAKFGKFCIFVLLACSFYYTFHQLFLYFADFREVDSYNNINHLVRGANGAEFLLSVVKEFLYTYFYGLVHFLRPITYFKDAVGIAHALLAFITIYQIARVIVIKKLPLLSVFFIAILLVLLLPCIYFVRILAGGMSHPGILNIECFVMMSFVLLFISARELYPRMSPCAPKWQTRLNYTVILICLLSFYSNWIYANRLFFLRELIAKTSLSFCTRLVERIEQRDDYVPRETPIVFIGAAGQSPYLVTDRPAFADFLKTQFLSGPTLVEYELALYYNRYFNHLLGSTLQIKSANGDSNNTHPVECVEMPIFPKAGSIRNINNTLYVKLSELEPMTRE